MRVRAYAMLDALAVWIAQRVVEGEDIRRGGSTNRRRTTLVTHWARKYRVPRTKLDYAVRAALEKLKA